MTTYLVVATLTLCPALLTPASGSREATTVPKEWVAPLDAVVRALSKEVQHPACVTVVLDSGDYGGVGATAAADAGTLKRFRRRLPEATPSPWCEEPNAIWVGPVHLEGKRRARVGFGPPDFIYGRCKATVTKRFLRPSRVRGIPCYVQ